MATIRNLLVRLGLDVSDTEKGVSKLSGIMDKVGGLAGIAGGVAIGAGIASALDLSSARGKLQAQLGVTADEAKRIGSVAGKLYSQGLGATMDDVNLAVKSVVQNMEGMRNASSATLQDMTTKAMTVANVMDEDVGKVTAAVSTMMKSGLAPDAKTAFDVITRGAQLGGDKAQDLLDTFIEYSVQFKNMGLSSEQSMGIINQGLQAGARNADLVADTIKEFSIEAIAGGERVMKGFKSLGLNAGQMSQRLAAGGPTAAKALDLVFDKLRGIKDPIKQNAVAIELFGTKAEDMGKALFAIDPSKAVKSMGEVADATDKATKAIGETAATRLEAFKRSAQQHLTGALDNVIQKFNELSPETQKQITEWGLYVALAAPVGFAMMKIGGAALSVAKGVGTAAVGMSKLTVAAGKGAKSTFDTLRVSAMYAGDSIKGLGPKAAAAGSAIKTGVVSAAQYATNLGRAGLAAAGAATKQALLTGAQIAGNVASKALAAGTWLVNAALRANPIGLVVTILAALVGAIVLAYNKSDTFRKIVQTAWKGIQVAVSYAWNNVIKPAFNALWKFISNTLIPIITWLYKNVVNPYFNAIATVVKWAWDKVIKPAFDALWRFIVNTLAPKVLWFHNNVVKPTFDRIGSVISFAWNKVVKPVFDFLAKTVTKTVPDAFKRGVDAIKGIWNKVIDIAKKPVNFVIGLYNDGVANVVNKLASFVGIGARLPIIGKFERGGVLPGYAPGHDSLVAAVSPGESIFRPEFTRAVGSNWVYTANDIARTRGPQGVRKWLGELGGEGLAFAHGGVVPGFAGQFAFGGIIGKFVKGVKDFTIGNVAKGARSLLNNIFGAEAPGGGIIKQIISALPRWIVDKVVAWVENKVESGVGGPAIARAVRFAKSQAGKPYIWGGVGPHGYDCSGFMSAIQNIIRGRSPYSRLYSTFAFGGSGGPDGMVRNLRSGFMVGVTNAGVGHMAGTLGGKLNVESRGSAGVVVGNSARGFNNSLFPARYGLKYDQGGLLEPGYTLAHNATGKPEYVFTRDQFDKIAAGGNTYHITVEVPIGASRAAVGREVVECIKEYEARSGARWRGSR